MPLLSPLLLFGAAATSEGGNYIYKITGCGETDDTYRLVLEATDVTSSYITTFSLADVIKTMSEETGVEPEGAAMLDWMQQCFAGKTVQAGVSSSTGLQLAASHHMDGYEFQISLPPKKQRPLQPVASASGAAWVAQEVLFSMYGQRQHHQASSGGKQQPVPVSVSVATNGADLQHIVQQQVEDCQAFIHAQASGSSGSSEAAIGSLAPPLVAQLQLASPSKRKPEAPASGSAVKAARSNDTHAAAAGVAAAVPAASPAAVAAAQPPGPAGVDPGAIGVLPAASGAAAASFVQGAAGSTQQTAGMSSQSLRTESTVVGKPKRVAGRGGRGRGMVPNRAATKIGKSNQ